MIHARKDYERIQDPSNKIPEDEPVFLLRGQDISAPDAVREWARVNKQNGGDPNLSLLAEQHADAMIEWQNKTGKFKVADRP